MNGELLFYLYAGLFLIVFLAFGMQRATLLMSRQSGLPYETTSLLLPSWFPFVWLPRIVKWGMLAAIVYVWGWIIAVVVLLVDLVLSSVVPIPYRVYFPVFRKRIRSIEGVDPELAEILGGLVEASGSLKG